MTSKRRRLLTFLEHDHAVLHRDKPPEKTESKPDEPKAEPVPGAKPVSEEYKVGSVPDDKQKLPKNKGWEYVGKHPFRALIVGESGSGKTTLLMHLLNKFYRHYFDEIWIWSPNYHIDGTWKNIKFKPKEAFSTFEESDVKKLRDQQTSIIKTKGVLASKKILCVIDDFANDWQAMHSKGLCSFYTIGRHWNCSILVIVQKLTAVSLTMRTNVSNMFCFHASNAGEMETIRDEQTSQLITKKEFIRMFNEATTRKPYGFLSINHQAKPTEIYRYDLSEIQPITETVAEMEARERMEHSEHRKKLKDKPKEEEVSAVALEKTQ